MDETQNLNRFNRVILLQGTLTLIIFAALISAALLFFRAEIRQQILNRDGTLLTNIAQHFYKSINEADEELVLLDVALETSEIKNVIAVGLYSATGENISNIPSQLYSSAIATNKLVSLSSGKPVINYSANMQLAAIFSDVEAVIDENTYPVTQVLAPLFNSEGEFVAIIQYWLDSESIAHELHHMDKFLLLLGSAFIIGGGIIFFLVFFVSRQRLLKMGTMLAEQNIHLQKANANLSMAARTSAIGSISSHLFHGLKNPLAGLKSYLQVTGHDDEVLQITNRMQNLIDDSLSVIKEEESLMNQFLSMEEFAEVSSKRLHLGETDRVELTFSGRGKLPSHKLQLLLLIVQNLVDNALVAASEVRVSIEFICGDKMLETFISDDGPGLPEHVRSHIFEPVRSTRQDGTGIGLAISAEIARHIPASLNLVKSDSSGTRFKIDMSL